jgi:hypothetical protein
MAGLCLALSLAACAHGPTPAGGLTGYDQLGEEQGLIARRRIHADVERLREFDVAQLAPITFSTDVEALTSEEERALIVRRLSRSLCERLSRRIQLVSEDSAGALSLRVHVSELRRTNAAAAAASAITWVRVPIGLGALGVEAEAVTPVGEQVVAMVWRRSAEPLFSGARVSRIGDAYDFAAEFGDAFARLLIGQDGRGDSARFVGIPTELPRLGGEDQCAVYGGTRLSVDAATMFSPVQPPPSWSERPLDRTEAKN